MLQRVVMAYRLGRPVELDRILNHELMSIPLSLASTDGMLHPTNKANMIPLLCPDDKTLQEISLSENESSCLVID